MYLLMSVWLALHASILAQCSSVRLLTQFVRLPVPTWDQLENMRTYAQSVEGLGAAHLLRVPFSGAKNSKLSGNTPSHACSSPDLSVVAEEAGTQPSQAADPWGLEKHGDGRDIYELQARPAALRRHVVLAKRAAAQYQCYDAFARVSMSFGTLQLLHAIGYYCLGYVAIQDGAVWPAWCVVAIMASMAIALVQLDFSLTRKEQLLARVLVVAGPSFSALATSVWMFRRPSAQAQVMMLLPVAYASHGCWLFFALLACGITLLPSGAILPMKFRSVLYLDVFGFLSNKDEDSALQKGSTRTPAHDIEIERAAKLEALRADVAQLQNSKIAGMMEEHDRERVERLAQKLGSATSGALNKSNAKCADTPSSGQDRKFVKLRTHTDFGTEVPYLYDPESGEVVMPDDDDSDTFEVLNARSVTQFEDDADQYCASSTSAAPEGGASSGGLLKQMVSPMLNALNSVEDGCHDYTPLLGNDGVDMADARPSSQLRTRWLPQENGPSGELMGAPNHVFHPTSYLHRDLGDDSLPGSESEIVTGHDKLGPGQLPAKIFRSATLMLVFLWALGLAVPFGVFREFMAKPLTADLLVEEELPGGKNRGTMRESVRMAVGTSPSGLPELIPEYEGREDIPALPEGELVKVDWPSHSGFVPRSLSCDPSGNQLVVADDLGVYTGLLSPSVALRAVAAIAGVGSSGGVDDLQARRLDAMPSAAEATKELNVVRRGSKQPAAVSFERVPPCTALEGQALKDIGVVCSEVRGGELRSSCRVVVLHARGRRLAECPLHAPNVENFAMEIATINREHKGVDDPASPRATWTISSDWLHSHHQQKQEYVESIAVNSACHRSETGSSGIERDAFHPGALGCVVVGTTSGRIVQLRGAADQKSLVPERAMQQRSRAVNRGSLHVLPTGFVMALRRGFGTVQAFDSALGTAVGEWRLPTGVHWLTLCGGGENLFVLGLRNRSHVELHRFPLPAQLKAFPLHTPVPDAMHWRLSLPAQEI